jgi:2-oxoglutarate ferredoxin oxidoreductase subunit beta
MALTVVCVNNFTYGMTGGQVAATTPFQAKTTTTPKGNHETPFNLPLLAYASGATLIARWTILHARDLTECLKQAFQHSGFSFVEILSPCPVNYGRRNRQSALDMLKMFQDKCIIRNGANPAEVEMDFARRIVLGNFVHVQRPTCIETYDKTCRLTDFSKERAA